MAKYAMLNCWDDCNRGDLGIMIATIAELRNQDHNAKIIGISCFNEKDPKFTSSHEILSSYVSQIYPALFGILGICVKGEYKKTAIFKLLCLLSDMVRFIFIMSLPISLTTFFLSKSERKTLEALQSCDICFSKGGSVFTDYGDIRGAISLIRMCWTYAILKKFGCKYYILGQSFGPVSNKIASSCVNNVIHGAEYVYLRELLCVEEYKNLDLKAKNVGFSNDSAFLLEPIAVSPDPIDSSYYNVGITLRSSQMGMENYVNTIVKFIDYLVNDKTRPNTHVHILQQVTMNEETDNITAEQVLDKLSIDTRKNVTYHTEELLPQELCWLYGRMDVLIGTRLHSTIFAMRAGTLPIGLVYHGTKTQGIFSTIGIPELVVSYPITYEKLCDRYIFLCNNKERLLNILLKGVSRAQNEMRQAITAIVTDARKGKGECI